METVGDRQLLEVQPEALNGIEKRTVFGKPDDEKAVVMEAQGGLSSLAAVVGSVVHHQNEMLTWIGVQEVFEKSDKGITIFVGSGEMTDLPGVPVVSAKNMEILRATRSGNELTLATAHPAAAQNRMQAYGRFVHKEEFGFGDGVKGDVFFNQSITCAAVSCAGRSCK